MFNSAPWVMIIFIVFTQFFVDSKEDPVKLWGFAKTLFIDHPVDKVI